MGSIEGVIQLTQSNYAPGILYGDVNQPSQSIVDTQATQQYEVGTKLVYADGRVFRYAKNGGVDLVKARMTQTRVVDTLLDNVAQATSGTAVEIGDSEIVADITTGSALTEDELAGATLAVNGGTAIGDVYRILANKLIVGDDTKVRLLLEYPIRTAWAADTEITIMPNRWMEVVIFPTTRTGTATGIPMVMVPISNFCWLQTAGPAGAITDDGETMIIGAAIGEPGTHGDPGGIGIVANDGTDEVWGHCMWVAAADDTTIVDLTLD